MVRLAPDTLDSGQTSNPYPRDSLVGGEHYLMMIPGQKGVYRVEAFECPETLETGIHNLSRPDDCPALLGDLDPRVRFYPVPQDGDVA